MVANQKGVRGAVAALAMAVWFWGAPVVADDQPQDPADAGVASDAAPAPAPPVDAGQAPRPEVTDDASTQSSAPPVAPTTTAAPSAGSSQDPAATDPELIEVQGTAPAETGTSTSILTRSDIERLPGGDAQSLTQIALTQSGFTPDSFGPDGVFHIRGGETGVLYMVDGIQLPNGLAGQFTDVLPTALVQRMNLVVGGMPVEYGPSTGGVFDITTRRGSDVPAGEAEIVYGTYQKVQPSAWYSQAFGKLNVFAAGTYLSTDRGLDPPAVTPILHDQEKAGNALARINYDATDNDRIEIVTRYSEQHFEIPDRSHAPAALRWPARRDAWIRQLRQRAPTVRPLRLEPDRARARLLHHRGLHARVREQQPADRSLRSLLLHRPPVRPGA